MLVANANVAMVLTGCAGALIASGISLARSAVKRLLSRRMARRAWPRPL